MFFSHIGIGVSLQLWTSPLLLLSNNGQCVVPRKIKGMPCLSVRSGRWLFMLPLAERWGSPSSPLLWNHLEVGVIWLPRPSAVLVASWARDLASPPPSPLANCFRGAPCRCGEGMLPCGCTVSLQSPPSLTVLSDFFFFVYRFDTVSGILGPAKFCITHRA